MTNPLNLLIARGPQGGAADGFIREINRRRDEQAAQQNELARQQYEQQKLQEQRQYDQQQADAEDVAWGQGIDALRAATDEPSKRAAWYSLFKVDPQHAKMLYEFEQGMQPQQSIAPTEITLPSGRILAMQGDNPIGSPWEKPSPNKGATIRLPDGTVMTTGGVPNYAPTEASRATRTNLEQAFYNAQSNAFSLQEQVAKWRPEFSTYGGQFKATAGTVAEKAGADLSPEQQQYLSDYNSWRSDTNALLSQYLNQLSGAAISPAEEARLKGGFPNAEDGPSQYYAKVKRTLARFALIQARAAYVLSSPGVTMDSVSLDKMQNIIVTEANALAASYQKSMPADKAKSEALRAVRAKYGIGNGN